MGDDAWKLFSRLCAIVCENDDVFLDIIVTNGLIEMMLMPMGEELDD